MEQDAALNTPMGHQGIKEEGDAAEYFGGVTPYTMLELDPNKFAELQNEKIADESLHWTYPMMIQCKGGKVTTLYQNELVGSVREMKRPKSAEKLAYREMVGGDCKQPYTVVHHEMTTPKSVVETHGRDALITLPSGLMGERNDEEDLRTIIYP